MDQEQIICIVAKSAKEVFGTMLGLDVELGASFIETGTPAESQKVVALIGLTGKFVGTGVIGCNPQFACRIASLMLMTEYEAVNEDVLDAMAEIANMIFGSVKTELEEHLGPMGLSIPTVIFGRNFATRRVGQQSWTVLPLKAGESEMEIKFCFVQNRDGQTSGRIPRVQPTLVETT